jgi:hypothetical protein
MTNKTKIAGLVGAVVLFSGAQAQAEITWRFDSSPYSGYTTVNSTTAQKISDGVTATAQGWSNTNNATASTANTLGSTSISSTTSYKLEDAYLYVYDGGIGVKNRDASSSTSSYGDNSENNSPEHSVDNNQRYDSVLFSFSEAIDLNSVSIGWWNNDSDISVLRYDGAGVASDIAGKTYAQLLTSGWNLVSQNAASTASNKVLDGSTASSYWLIGAANPLLGTVMDSKRDYVKILALAGTVKVPPSGVPEPGTLLLMGAGLFGLSRFNARRPVRCAV